MKYSRLIKFMRFKSTFYFLKLKLILFDFAQKSLELDLFLKFDNSREKKGGKTTAVLQQCLVAFA